MKTETLSTKIKARRPNLVLPLDGFSVEELDGAFGTISDFLFEDVTWHVRWAVVATGGWLTGRKHLVHPSAIVRVDQERHALLVRLSKAEVRNSPDILLDEPVSRAIEYGQQHSPGWDPAWGNPRYVAGFWGGIGVRVPHSRSNEEKAMSKLLHSNDIKRKGDPHLRSASAIIGCRVRATDGLIGHVAGIILDQSEWVVRMVVVETNRWWPGKRLTVPVSAVSDISWPHQEVRLKMPSHEI